MNKKTKLILNSDRIAILGMPALGKSVISKSIQNATGLPLVHLDQVQAEYVWPPGFSDAFLKRYLCEVAKPQWIIEGTQLETAPYAHRLDHSDRIVYIRGTPEESAQRVYDRSLNIKNGIEERHGCYDDNKSNVDELNNELFEKVEQFMHWIITGLPKKYEKLERELFSHHHAKTIFIESREELTALQDDLRSH